MGEDRKGDKRLRHSKRRRPKISKSSSFVNLDDDLNLKPPSQVRKDVKHLVLKTIDEAADVSYFIILLIYIYIIHLHVLDIEETSSCC